MRVFVYWNLHRNLWSIRALRGKVLAHSQFVSLVDCELKVSEKGRQRVIRTGHKNVHAGVVGTLVGLGGARWVEGREVPGVKELDSWDTGEYTEIRYNPYKTRLFVEALRPHMAVLGASTAILRDNRRVYVLDHEIQELGL